MSAPAKHQSSLVLFLFCLGISLTSCGPAVDEKGYTLIDTEDNPDALAYRFVEISSQGRTVWVLDPDKRDRIGVYRIGRDYDRADSSTGILFAEFRHSSMDMLCMAHFPVAKIVSHFPFDYDLDGFNDLVVPFVRRDTAWVQVLNRECQLLLERVLLVGEDRNGDGIWDGFCNAAEIPDMTGDGHSEVLFSCDAGYDRYPRRLICMDLRNDSVLWETDRAGHSVPQYAQVIGANHNEPPLLVIGDHAPNNGAVADSLDDAHSHLMCYDADGKLRWMRITGERFTSTLPLLLHSGNGEPRICTRFFYRMSNDYLASGLLVIDRAGRTIDSAAFKSRITWLFQHDFDHDGDGEIVASFDDLTLAILRSDLTTMANFRFNRELRPLRAGDFCGNGGIQILAEGAQRELWLLSEEFGPLAYMPAGGSTDFLRTEGDGLMLLVHKDGQTHFNMLERNPWYRGFFLRNRLKITGAFGALVAALAVVGFYHRRTRRDLETIRRQKTQLEELHAKLQEAQQQIIAHEKYQQAKDIAGGVAHEIHNALCPALNSLEVLSGRLEHDDQIDEQRTCKLLDLAKAAVSRGLEMTELVAAYSKLESEKQLTQVRLQPLLDEVVEANRLRIDELNVSVTWDLTDDAAIACNRTHAFVLLNNLMVNALDALSEVTRRSVHVSARPRNGHIEIRFADSGPGIAADIRDRIFDVFYSTRPSRGRGLGLSMVKKIAEMYGGTVAVESSPTTGATFTILFLGA
jgi:signal transduction histidine kinase